MADGKATKIVVPTELAGIAGSLTAVAELLQGNGGNGDGAAEASQAPRPPTRCAPCRRGASAIRRVPRRRR